MVAIAVFANSSFIQLDFLKQWMLGIIVALFFLLNETHYMFFMTQHIAKGLLFLPGDKCYSVNKVTLTELRNDIDNLISISFILLLRQYLCSISCVNILSVLSSVNLHSNELTSSSSSGNTRGAFCFVLTSTWIRRRFLTNHFYCGMSFDFITVISAKG